MNFKLLLHNWLKAPKKVDLSSCVKFGGIQGCPEKQNIGVHFDVQTVPPATRLLNALTPSFGWAGCRLTPGMVRVLITEIGCVLAEIHRFENCGPIFGTAIGTGKLPGPYSSTYRYPSTAYTRTHVYVHVYVLEYGMQCENTVSRECSMLSMLLKWVDETIIFSIFMLPS